MFHLGSPGWFGVRSVAVAKVTPCWCRNMWWRRRRKPSCGFWSGRPNGGAAAARVGSGQESLCRDRWSGLALACGRRPFQRRHPRPGFSSRQRASLGGGARPAWPGEPGPSRCCTSCGTGRNKKWSEPWKRCLIRPRGCRRKSRRQCARRWNTSKGTGNTSLMEKSLVKEGRLAAGPWNRSAVSSRIASSGRAGFGHPPACVTSSGWMSSCATKTSTLSGIDRATFKPSSFGDAPGRKSLTCASQAGTCAFGCSLRHAFRRQACRRHCSCSKEGFRRCRSALVHLCRRRAQTLRQAPHQS